MNPKVIKIIKTIAENDPKLLTMISLLPTMKCDEKFFSIEKWKRQIDQKKVNVSNGMMFDCYLQDYHYDNNWGYSSYLQRAELDDSRKSKWQVIVNYDTILKNINTKTISDLIDACKNKNIEELLNFL